MAYTNFTNCTKEQYESIIYSEEDKNRIRIWFNNVELLDADEYCESFSGTNRILPDDGNKIFTLDNFIAKNYTLVLRDLPEGTIISDQVKVSIGTLVNENNNTYEDVPIGIFNIQDTPINDKGRVTIKLRDNRVKFDFNYNAQPLIESLGGTATKKQILEDICNQAGVTNNVSTFNGEDDEIGIYDNTITATTYVSYIFEQAGLMPFINREGQLDKINLNDLKVWRIPLSIVEKYEKGTPFKIERVVYESGIIKYESSNDESLDTLYLNSANPYINNKQQIDNIYNLLVGFSADSVKSGRILGNPAIDPFDMILIYDDEINDNPISTSTGTNLTLENTPNASTNIDLLGNTTQETTTGKNLFISSTSSTTTSGMTFTKNSDGSWTLNGTNNSGSAYYLRLNDNFTLQAGTYTLSNSNPNVNNDTGAIFYDDNSNLYPRQNIVTKTFSSSVTIKPYIKWNNGATLSNFKIYPMIERGSNYTGFEPYTGTQPSPNPNYPQNVETTTGRNTINVSEKNLFTTGNGTSSRIGVNATYNGSEVVLNGTTTSAGNIFYDETISLNTGYRKSQKLPAGTYTLSTKTTGSATYPSGVGIAIYIRDGSGTILKSFSSIANYQTTLTLNSETQIYSQMYINGSGGVYNNYSIHFQIEKGSSSSTYEPYIGNSYEVNLGKNLFDEEQLLQATGWQKQNDIYFGTIDTWYSKFRYGFTGLHFKTNTQYTISLKGYTTGGTPRVQIVYTDNSSELINIYASTMTSYIKTTNASKSVSNIKVDYGTGSANTLYLTQFMIEEGNVASSYSPYFEPIELCKIGTYQDRLFKASGKNLYNPTNLDFVIRNGRYSKYGNGVISNVPTAGDWFSSPPPMSTTPTQEQKDIVATYGFLVKSNTQYTLSFDNPNTCHTQIQVFHYDKDLKYIKVNSSSTSNNAKHTYTFTTDSNASYIMVRFDNESYGYGTAKQLSVQNIMLEKSSSATSFEPYGNYWYKYNAIGKVVLNGTENYSNQSGEYDTTTRMMFSVNPSSIPQNMTNRKAVCNYFINYNGSVQNRNVDVTAFNFNNSPQYSNYMYFKLEKSVLPTQDATGFKNWVASHNLIIYYQLATPTYTKIENEELIGQLNRLKTIQTIEGTTNIQQNNSSLPFELNVEYFNESYILKTLANNTYKYTGINRNEFDTEISLEQRKENVSIKSEATYQKMAKTEIDAANATISLITGELGMDSEGNSQVIEGIRTTQTQNSLDIEAITSYQEVDGKRTLTGVKTGKGFTFNNSGLIITDASEQNTYKTKINEEGTYYYDGETVLGQTTNEGSKFKNMDLYGEFRYGKDNLGDNPLFVSMKYTDANGNVGFGHFWNGN